MKCPHLAKLKLVSNSRIKVTVKSGIQSELRLAADPTPSEVIAESYGSFELRDNARC